MGLFDKIGKIGKKECSVCGREVGPFSRTKLADGYLCHDCATRLSPFWSPNRSVSVAQVHDHLAYREQNLHALDDFHPNVELGGRRHVLIDQEAGTFVLTSDDDENPDLLGLAQVREVTYDVTEHDVTETDGDGDSHHDHYEYNFYLVVELDNPHVRHARFRINERAVWNRGKRIRPRDAEAYHNGSKEIRGGLFSRTHKEDTERYMEWYSDLREMADGLREAANIG